MKDFRELIDMVLNDEIISDEIYDGESVKDITDRATLITAENQHKADPEKVSDTCTHLNKEKRKKLYLLLNKY